MSVSPQWRFHAERDRLLAEAHARPSTPVQPPLLAARIVTMSGEGGVDADRSHMAALCRKIGVSEPGPDARWGMVDGGAWRLRWERHTEVSTWTVFRPHADGDRLVFAATALDLVPQDWLGALPGAVLAAAHVALVDAAAVDAAPAAMALSDDDLVASHVGGGALQAYTDFRPGPDGFTRFVLVQTSGGPVLAGRILQQLFEIETYRLMALLAFPLATDSAGLIAQMESEAAEAAFQVTEAGDAEADRALLSRLAVLAGRAEALAGSHGFRFSASRAYHGLVRERIRQLNEQPMPGRPTIGEFMERRLAPAMRTCEAAAERQRDVIGRIARTAQMLSTRVEVAAEATNARLLESMDRRAQLQLRLQETVEGLSAAAISYYALGLLKFLVEGVAEVRPAVNPTLTTGLAAPVVIFLVWMFLRRLRTGILAAHQAPGRAH